MTGSNAEVLDIERKEIVMTRRIKKQSLAAQKLAGLAMLVSAAAGTIMGNEFTALLVLSPLALAAVFSKEKIMDFGIFRSDCAKRQGRNF